MILTEREKEYLYLFCFKDEEIAEKLFVSKYTVKVMNHRIFRKLEVKNKESALVLAIRSGILNVFDIVINDLNTI